MADPSADAILSALGPSGKGAPKGKPDAKEEGAEDSIEAAAAQDALDAVKAGDAGAFQDALRRFVSSCMQDYGEDEG